MRIDEFRRITRYPRLRNYLRRAAAGTMLTADLSTAGTRVTLAVKNTPHNNFNAIIEVPKTSDFVLRLIGGDLEVAAITGNKDFASQAGDVGIAAGNPRRLRQRGCHGQDR